MSQVIVTSERLGVLSLEESLQYLLQKE